MRNTSPYGLSHAPGQLDLHVNVPDSNAHVFGVDLTHIIHTNEVDEYERVPSKSKGKKA